MLSVCMCFCQRENILTSYLPQDWFHLMKQNVRIVIQTQVNRMVNNASYYIAFSKSKMHFFVEWLVNCSTLYCSYCKTFILLPLFLYKKIL